MTPNLRPFLHQKHHISTLILQFFNNTRVSNIGNKNELPQDMPLWHKDYFELKENENQLLQKETFLELLLSDYKEKILRNKDCYKSPFLGKFYEHEQDKANTEMGIHKTTLISTIPPYIFHALVSHSQKTKALLFCIVTCIPIYYSDSI